MAKPDSLTLRACLGNFATGVTIVTCDVDGDTRGATVNSFTSVSLDPPLVLTCLAKQSRACAYLRDRSFTVNILSIGQQQLAMHFAGREQLEPEPAFEPGAVSSRIQGCVAYVSCQPWNVYDAGDHDLVIGEVVDIDVPMRTDLDRPLLFYRGGFWHLGTAHDSLAAQDDAFQASALSW
jgi:flavin reductase (DIM6/NTAB) family NADH-FMN oxidoreductase RutF